MKKEIRTFYSSDVARSFIRGIAERLSEEDPELIMEFLNALDITNAALVSWLVEDKAAENFCLRVGGAGSREFLLAVERLKVTLAKLNDSKRRKIKQVVDEDFHISPRKGIVPDGKA